LRVKPTFSTPQANYHLTQRYHAGLPLLAESKKGFFRMKVFKTILGLIAGIAGYMTGF
jgi:hypothetical protein